MNHRDKLIQIYELISKKSTVVEIKKIPQEILGKIDLIAQNCSKQKGVYTVLVRQRVKIT